MTSDGPIVRFAAATSRRFVDVAATLDAISPGGFTLTTSSGVSPGTTGVLIVPRDGDTPIGLPAHIADIEPVERGWRVVGGFTYLAAETRDALDAFIARGGARDDNSGVASAVELAG